MFPKVSIQNSDKQENYTNILPFKAGLQIVHTYNSNTRMTCGPFSYT